jgi:hypothetical protein
MKGKIDLRKCKVVARGTYKWVAHKRNRIKCKRIAKGTYRWVAPKKHSGTYACDLVLIEKGKRKIFRPICVKGDEVRFRILEWG